MEGQAPFVFQTERRLIVLTGRKAHNLRELAGHLHEVSGSSIFYHTHHQYLSHHFEKPVFHNDFAIWVSVALLEEPLSEKLAAIDLLAFSSIRQLRDEIVSSVESYVSEVGGRIRDCQPGYEFHFSESKSFIMPSGIVAKTIPDFFVLLPKVTNASLYFHFFEARLRMGKPTNDFSAWLSYCGAEELAQDIDRLNPYMMTMEELREEIIKLGEKRGLGNGSNVA